jgi:membrane protein
VAITVVGTGAGETVLRLAGWQGAGWTQLTRFGLGLLVGLVADWLIFFWIITRLPRIRGPVRGATRAALLGAVGLEVLRQGLTLYLGRIAVSPGGVVFGSLLGLLVFAYLVSRFVLMVTAWAATVAGNQVPEPPRRTDRAPDRPGAPARIRRRRGSGHGGRDGRRRGGGHPAAPRPSPRTAHAPRSPPPVTGGQRSAVGAGCPGSGA